MDIIKEFNNVLSAKNNLLASVEEYKREISYFEEKILELKENIKYKDIVLIP